MSRIGKRVLNIPENTKVIVENNVIDVSGPLGKLNMKIDPNFHYKIENNTLSIVPNKPVNKNINIMHGTINSLIYNMICGVNKKYEKDLEIIGVGYRAKLEGKTLTLKLGFSHDVIINVPEDIEIDVKKATKINLKSINKENLGAFAAKIRSYKTPEPYLGKGIRYKNEHIKKKEGKAAGKGK